MGTARTWPPCVVVVLPVLFVKHAIIKPRVKGDGQGAQEVIKLPMADRDLSTGSSRWSKTMLTL